MNNLQKIDGSELSSYVTTAISVGQSTRENQQGRKSMFAVFTIKNKKQRFAKASRIILFDDQLEATAFETLRKFKAIDANGKDIVDPSGHKVIDLKALKASGEDEDIEPYYEIPGGIVVEYKLSKGDCYQNGVDGKRRTLKDGTPIIRNSISVFVIVDCLIPDGENLKTVYAAGFSPTEQGRRMEDSFYKEAVRKNIVTDAPSVATDPTSKIEDEVSEAESEETPF